MKVFDAGFEALKRSLDVRQEKHAHLAQNLANVDTPDFEATDIDFEASMQAWEQGDDDAELAVVQGPSTAAALDDNSVDVDRTMADLAENGLEFQATARVLQKKLALLRYAANDGNGS